MTDHDETIERLRKLSDQLDAAKKASEETTREIEQAQRTHGRVERVLTGHRATSARGKKPTTPRARRTPRR